MCSVLANPPRPWDAERVFLEGLVHMYTPLCLAQRLAHDRCSGNISLVRRRDMPLNLIISVTPWEQGSLSNMAAMRRLCTISDKEHECRPGTVPQEGCGSPVSHAIVNPVSGAEALVG